MNLSIIFNCTAIVGFAYLALVVFDRKRVRAPWAKSVFVICSIVGIVAGVIGLAWDLGWFFLASEATRRLEGFLSFAHGLSVGFLFSLIFSGQFTGAKNPQRETERKQP
jgi:hypothetical protein